MITQKFQSCQTSGTATAVWRTHIGGVTAKYAPHYRFKFCHLQLPVGLRKSIEVEVVHGVARNLVSACIHSPKYCCPRKAWISQRAFPGIICGDKEGTLYAIGVEDVKQLTRPNVGAIIISQCNDPGSIDGSSIRYGSEPRTRYSSWGCRGSIPTSTISRLTPYPTVV